MLFLERANVLRTDLRRELDLRIVEALAHARFTEAVADLEHSAAHCRADSHERTNPRGAAKARRSPRQSTRRARRRCRRRRGAAPAGSGPLRPPVRA